MAAFSSRASSTLGLAVPGSPPFAVGTPAARTSTLNPQTNRVVLMNVTVSWTQPRRISFTAVTSGTCR